MFSRGTYFKSEISNRGRLQFLISPIRMDISMRHVLEYIVNNLYKVIYDTLISK